MSWVIFVSGLGFAIGIPLLMDKFRSSSVIPKVPITFAQLPPGVRDPRKSRGQRKY